MSGEKLCTQNDLPISILCNIFQTYEIFGVIDSPENYINSCEKAAFQMMNTRNLELLKLHKEAKDAGLISHDDYMKIYNDIINGINMQNSSPPVLDHHNNGDEISSNQQQQQQILTIVMRGDNGFQVPVKMTSNTPFGRAFKAYCGAIKQAKPISLRFMFNGVHLTDTDTPKVHDMENDDQIDVLSYGPQEITIIIKDSVGKLLTFKNRRMDQPFLQLFQDFGVVRGVNFRLYRFSFDGRRLSADGTPKDFDMEDKDIIDALRYN